MLPISYTGQTCTLFDRFGAILSFKPSATTFSLGNIYNLRSLFHWPPDCFTLTRKLASSKPICMAVHTTRTINTNFTPTSFAT